MWFTGVLTVLVMGTDKPLKPDKKERERGERVSERERERGGGGGRKR